MSRQWHIDNASALIIDGTRFTQQNVSWRSEPGSSLLSAQVWVKDANQSGPGLKISAPLYLPEEYWAHYDDYGNQVTTFGIVLKERTWMYYGTAGYAPGGTQYPITTLSPYATSEVSGSALALDGLRAFPGANAPNLYIGNNAQSIVSGFFATVGVATHFQFHGLGVL